MKTIGNNPDKTRQTQVVASGTLPNGKPVVVNSDGTVSVVDGSVGATGADTVFAQVGSSYISSAYDTNSNKVVVAYADQANSFYGKAVVGTVSGTSISFGSAVVFESAEVQDTAVTFDSNLNKIVIAYADEGNSSHGTAIVGTVSGTSISFGTAVVFEAANVDNISATFDSNSNKVVIAYSDIGNSDHGTAIVGTVSGTSISFGSAVVFEAADSDKIKTSFYASSNKVVICYRDRGNSNYGTAIVGTVSGTSISFGTPVVFLAANAGSINSPIYDSVSNKVVISFKDVGNSSYGTARVGTVSGTSISFGTAVVFNSGSTQFFQGAAYNPNIQRSVIAYRDDGDSSIGKYNVGTVSGTDISFSGEIAFSTARADNMSLVYDPDTANLVMSYEDAANSSYGTSFVFTPSFTSLTSENYVGMSSGAAELENVGSPVTFESGATSYSVNTYDSNADRMVVAYSDAGDSGKGKVAVGTVSGDTTSFGTPVDFTNYQVQQARIVFDTNSNKIVIAWIKSSDNAGMSIVGTVDPSDNSISFGSEVQFEAGLAHMSLGFDSTNNKIISAFADLSDNNHGYAIVGTVSGTSISFGSISKFEAENTRHTDIAHDPDAGKTVIAYMDQGNSSYGTAVVSTVSGTSISFGTPVVYESSSTNDNSVVYDTNSNKMVIAYSDGGNSSYGTAVVGTVSGTSISFGTPVVFHAAGYILQPICTFDAGSNKVVIVYMDNANDGRYVVGAVSGTSISFDASSLVESNATFSNESFWVSNIELNKNSIVYRDDASSNVGRAVVLSLEQRGEVASGGAATVDIIGSLSTNQGNLTAGQSYYVQKDGTLGTTPADPSVFAGTAVSATKLIVKG